MEDRLENTVSIKGDRLDSGMMSDWVKGWIHIYTSDDYVSDHDSSVLAMLFYLFQVLQILNIVCFGIDQFIDRLLPFAFFRRYFVVFRFRNQISPKWMILGVKLMMMLAGNNMALYNNGGELSDCCLWCPIFHYLNRSSFGTSIAIARRVIMAGGRITEGKTGDDPTGKRYCVRIHSILVVRMLGI